MDYRVDVDFLEHPKTLHLLELAGSDGLVWLLKLWAYTTKHRPSGELSGLNARRIEAALQFAHESLETYEATPPVNRVNILVESGWLTFDKNTQTYSTSGWKEYQTWVIGAKERSEAARKAAKVLWDNKKILSGEQADSNAGRMRDASESHDAVVDAPSPSPIPSPLPKEKKNMSAVADPRPPVEKWLDWRKSESGQKKLHELLSLTRSDADTRPRLTETEFREALKDKEQWLRDHEKDPKVRNRVNWSQSASNWMKIAYERKKERESRATGFTTNLSDRAYDETKRRTGSGGGFTKIGDMVND